MTITGEIGGTQVLYTGSLFIGTVKDRTGGEKIHILNLDAEGGRIHEDVYSLLGFEVDRIIRGSCLNVFFGIEISYFAV